MTTNQYYPDTYLYMTVHKIVNLCKFSVLVFYSVNLVLIYNDMSYSKANSISDGISSGSDGTELELGLTPCQSHDTFLEYDGFTSRISDDCIDIQAENLFKDFNEALKDNAEISMLPNYNIQPTGLENGHFLVIDLGGSTLRVAVVSIDEYLAGIGVPPVSPVDRVHILHEESWLIPNTFKSIDYNFFRYIGTQVKQVLSKQNVLDLGGVINTGITWSFPLETTSHNSGKIIHVTKGYTVSSEIHGRDLKEVLELVLNSEFGFNVDVKAILNDTLAVYAAGSFVDKYMKLGLVLGTGINMCCALDSSSKINTDKTLKGEVRVLYNTELSFFGQKLIPDFVNKYDQLIDSRSSTICDSFRSFMGVDPISKRLFQPIELMTSGRYLPELARLVIVDQIKDGNLFAEFHGEDDFDQLLKPYEGFSGELMCYIDENNSFDLISARLSRECNLLLKLINPKDIIILKNLIHDIIKRAATIVSIAIIALVKLLHHHNFDSDFENRIDIGFVGSVLHHFNHYKNLILFMVNNHEFITLLGLTVELKMIKHSSIIGAAVGAAYYS